MAVGVDVDVAAEQKLNQNLYQTIPYRWIEERESVVSKKLESVTVDDLDAVAGGHGRSRCGCSNNGGNNNNMMMLLMMTLLRDRDSDRRGRRRRR